MRFTIPRILGIAPVMALGLLLFPAPGLAEDRPDLVVTFLGAPPATAVPGDGFVISATVRNQGVVAADVSITKFGLISTTGGAPRNLKGVQNIAALAPGASDTPAVTLAIYSDTAPGTYRVVACANGAAPRIAESNTTNNCLASSGTITVFDVPDLAVTAITNPPTPVPQGQGFDVTYTVTNTGVVAAAASLVKFSLVATVGTAQIDLKTDNPEAVGALGAGATFTHTVNAIVRPETPPGTYRLRACADSGKTVPEHHEDDNCKTSVGTAQVTPRPDLIVKKVTVTGAPLAVEQGAPLAIEVVVRNDGLLDAPASTLKFVLLRTAALLSKNLKGTIAVPGVPAGTKVTLNATPLVYDDTEPGSYTAQACVDSKKVVAETFESNNCQTAPGTVTVTGVPLSPADLAVTALTPPPATRLPGETFPLTASVQNHGTAAGPATTSKFYLVNAAGTVRKNLKGVQSIGPLGAGATDATQVTVQLYADTVPGAYHLQACADAELQIREVNEDDNCLTSAGVITVLQVPDLVITQVGNPPATILPAKSFSVTETVKNVGPVGALASRVKFSLVSTVDATTRFDLSGSQDVPPLGSTAIFNGSRSVTVRPETQPGLYYVQACADAGKVVLESDEDANCALSGGAVRVVAVPDLIVTAVRLPTPPVPVAHGSTVALTAVVKNQGFGDAGASYLKFSLVATPGAAPIRDIPEAVPVAALAHGAKAPTTGTVTIRKSTPPGTYFVQACVAIANVVESSNQNNCGTSVDTIQVQ